MSAATNRLNPAAGGRKRGNPAAPAIHSAVGIYEPCHCDPAETDYWETHFQLAGVGFTCERGLLFTVCSMCCTGAEGERHCSQAHQHGAGRPHCPLTTDSGDLATAQLRTLAQRRTFPAAQRASQLQGAR